MNFSNLNEMIIVSIANVVSTIQNIYNVMTAKLREKINYIFS